MVRDAVKLKKEAFQLVLTEGSPDSLEMCRRARRAVAIAFAEAKVQTWEKFGESMEKDDWIWQEMLDKVGYVCVFVCL